MHDEYTLRLLNTKFDVIVEIDFKTISDIIETLFLIEKNGLPYELLAITPKKGGDAD